MATTSLVAARLVLVLFVAAVSCTKDKPRDRLVGLWKSGDVGGKEYWFVFRPVEAELDEKSDYLACYLGDSAATARDLLGQRDMLVWGATEGGARCIVSDEGGKRNVSLCPWAASTCTPSLAVVRLTVEFPPEAWKKTAAFVVDGKASSWTRVD